MLPEALNRATKAFLDCLQAIGLVIQLPESGTITGLTVGLIGHDENAFAILGSVRRVLREGGYPPEFIRAFVQEATASYYDHLLQTVMRYVEVE